MRSDCHEVPDLNQQNGETLIVTLIERYEALYDRAQQLIVHQDPT